MSMHYLHHYHHLHSMKTVKHCLDETAEVHREANPIEGVIGRLHIQSIVVETEVISITRQ